MTAEQRGVYRDLLDICWDQGSLTTDETALRRLAMCEPKEWKRAWPVVRDRFFVAEDGQYHNAKVDEKRPEIISAKEDRSKSASKAASMRWQGERNARHMRAASDPQCGFDANLCGTPSPSPSPCINTPLSPSTPNTVAPVDDWGDTFADTVERIFNRHAECRAKSNRQPGWGFQIFARRVQQDLQDASNRAKLLDRADRAHAFYIASVDDPKFCLSLDKWWTSGEWQNEPPSASPIDPMWPYRNQE